MRNSECGVRNENQAIPARFAAEFALHTLHSAFGMAAGAGFAPTWPPSKGGVLLIRRPGRRKWGLIDVVMD